MIGFIRNPQDSAFVAATSGNGSKAYPFITAVELVELDTSGNVIPKHVVDSAVVTGVGSSVVIETATDGINTWVRTTSGIGTSTITPSGWVKQ